MITEFNLYRLYQRSRVLNRSFFGSPGGPRHTCLYPGTSSRTGYRQILRTFDLSDPIRLCSQHSIEISKFQRKPSILTRKSRVGILVHPRVQSIVRILPRSRYQSYAELSNLLFYQTVSSNHFRLFVLWRHALQLHLPWFESSSQLRIILLRQANSHAFFQVQHSA